MRTARKPRADSRLATLPEAQQEELEQFAATHTLAQTRDELSRRGIRSSLTAISRWLQQRRLRSLLIRQADTVRQLLDWYQQRRPDASEEELGQLGQMFFSALALQAQDTKAWVHLQSLALRRRQLELDRAKLEWLQRRADQADQAEAVLDDASLSAEERQRRIKEIFGRA
jgi:hypothetical protein